MLSRGICDDPGVKPLLDELENSVAENGEKAPNQLCFVDWAGGTVKLPLTFVTGDRVASTNLLGDASTVQIHLARMTEADDPIDALDKTRADAIPQARIQDIVKLEWRDDQPTKTATHYSTKPGTTKKIVSQHQSAETANKFRRLLASHFDREPSQGLDVTVSPQETFLKALIPAGIVTAICAVLGVMAQSIQATGIDAGQGYYKNKGASILLQSAIGSVGPVGFGAIGVGVLLIIFGIASYKAIKRPTRTTLNLVD